MTAASPEGSWFIVLLGDLGFTVGLPDLFSLLGE